MNGPDDADGDVLRNLEENGFDFNKPYTIDFDIDFNKWPLTDTEKDQIKKIYPTCTFYDPDKEGMEEDNANGYVNLQIESKLTYEFVINTQEEITNNVKPFGGCCESWAVMH